ncbi:histidine--tRNA ligase [bacterium]|nr:histidine--tRNA ligase [bacterium]
MLKAIKGTRDILPGETETWGRIEQVVRDTMAVYGYSEIRTPVFEETPLFARSIGEDTDIVGKEMFTFTDMGGRSLTLRPEGTASVVRAFIEHSLDQRGLPLKAWYMGPMFRQERPQKGRQRQFHQFGVEAIGSPSPLVDAEVMILFDRICDRLGLGKLTVSVNSLGGPESRGAYREALVSFLDTVHDRLCDDCRRRKTTNPLRVLDCKVPQCRDMLRESGGLPRTLDYLTAEDKAHFEQVCEFLGRNDVAFTRDCSLVRGFDYYTGTVFEVPYGGTGNGQSSIGAQSSIMGGGRYDRLVSELGGPDVPAVGFACGIERLILAMESAGTITAPVGTAFIYVVGTGAGSQERVMRHVQAIRELGIPADMDYMGKSMKAQMKTAARCGARYSVIVEPDGDAVTVRDMEKSEQNTMVFDDFITILKKTVH